MHFGTVRNLSFCNDAGIGIAAGCMAHVLNVCCAPAVCTDSPGFADAYGTCEAYRTNSWCTQNGTAGSAWQASWGKLDPSVVRACCACGKQTMAGTLARVPATAFLPHAQHALTTLGFSAPHVAFHALPAFPFCVHQEFVRYASHVPYASANPGESLQTASAQQF